MYVHISRERNFFRECKDKLDFRAGIAFCIGREKEAPKTDVPRFSLLLWSVPVAVISPYGDW